MNRPACSHGPRAFPTAAAGAVIVVVGVAALAVGIANVPDGGGSVVDEAPETLPQVVRIREDAGSIDDLRAFMGELSDSYNASDIRECDDADRCFQAEYDIGDDASVLLAVVESEDGDAAAAMFDARTEEYGVPGELNALTVADGSRVGRYAVYGGMLDGNPNLAVWTNNRFYAECHGEGCVLLFLASRL